MAPDRAPLFVRLPSPLLDELNTRIALDGRTKQAVVEDLLSDQLRGPHRRADDDADDIADILDLGETAALLRVTEADVIDRIRQGDFPARRFGDDWRVSRIAVTAWLHGTDSTEDRRPGFTT